MRKVQSTDTTNKRTKNVGESRYRKLEKGCFDGSRWATAAQKEWKILKFKHASHGTNGHLHPRIAS
jgi:hypothetical protein